MCNGKGSEVGRKIVEFVYFKSIVQIILLQKYLWWTIEWFVHKFSEMEWMELIKLLLCRRYQL